MAIVSSQHGLYRLTLPQPTADKALVLISDLLPQSRADTGHFRELVFLIALYFEGERVDFPEDLDLRGSTSFQRDVWEATCSIPYGQTRTYSWIAQDIGRPKSVRAVGQALARNHLPIIVPCHRVLASNGGLGGYTGGLEMKKRLLDLELL